MTKGIATQNNAFKVYDVDASDELPGVVTIQLPSLELLKNSFKGAGVAGEINVPVPGMMSALTATLSFPKGYGGLARLFALAKTGTLDLRNDITVNNTDNHKLLHIRDRWVLKGPLSKYDPGKIEQAATSDGSIDLEVYKLQHWLDGEEVLEWDPFNYIYTVNGEDMLAELRQNILA